MNRGPPKKNWTENQLRLFRRKADERRLARSAGKAVLQMLRDMKKEENMAGKKKSFTKAEQAELFANLKLQKPDEDGFEIVIDPDAGEVFQFEADGDALEGIYVGFFTHHSEEYGTDSNCYKIYSPDDEAMFLAWGSFLMDKGMRGVRPGTYVRISYHGMAGRAHNFKVGVNKKLTSQYAKVAAEVIANQPVNTGDNLPF